MPNKLYSYWISFPENMEYPVGFGVSAFSIEDAFSMLESLNYHYHYSAKNVSIQKDVLPTDIEFDFVADTSGPIVIRGVWYPCHNIGF